MSKRQPQRGGKKGARSPQSTNSGVEDLRSKLDRVSTGSDSEDHPVSAIEEAISADDNPQMFEADPGLNGTQTLTPEQREYFTQELKKTEDEIATLRQVLQARMKHANELKRKLHITPWAEFQQDVSTGFKTVKETTAYQKTSDLVSQTGESISSKLGQLRGSTAFKSIEEKVGSAVSTVKAKMAASVSIDHLYGQTNDPETATEGERTSPTSSDKTPLTS